MFKNWKEFSLNESLEFVDGEELVLLVEKMQEDRVEWYTKVGSNRRKKEKHFYPEGSGIKRARTKKLRRVEFIQVDKALSKSSGDEWVIVRDLEDKPGPITLHYVDSEYLMKPSELTGNLLRLWNEDSSLRDEDQVMYLAQILALAEKCKGEIWVDRAEFMDAEDWDVDLSWAGLKTYNYKLDLPGYSLPLSFFNKEEAENVIKAIGNTFSKRSYHPSSWFIDNPSEVEDSVYDGFKYKLEPRDDDDDNIRSLISSKILPEMVEKWGCENLISSKMEEAQDTLKKLQNRKNATRVGLLD
jgi:hypothetical protein